MVTDITLKYRVRQMPWTPKFYIGNDLSQLFIHFFKRRNMETFQSSLIFPWKESSFKHLSKTAKFWYQHIYIRRYLFKRSICSVYWQMLFIFIMKHWSMILCLLCIDDSVLHYAGGYEASMSLPDAPDTVFATKRSRLPKTSVTGDTTDYS